MSRIIDTRRPEQRPRNVMQRYSAERTPNQDGTDFVRRALAWARNTAASAVADAPCTEYEVDARVQTTNSGAHVVYLQQQYKSIPIFQAAETVHFDPLGNLTTRVGARVAVQAAMPVVPVLTAAGAVQIAAQQVATPSADEYGAIDQFAEALAPLRVEVEGFAPRLIATFADQPVRSSVMEAGPFGEVIRASLTWFSLDNMLRLSWEVVISLPELRGQYRTLVDAQTGAVLYCADLVHSAISVEGNVFRLNGGEERLLTPFPDPRDTFSRAARSSADDRGAWVQGDTLVGAQVQVQMMPPQPPYVGTRQGDRLLFDPADPQGSEQKLLNLFYYICRIRDFFSRCGFDDAGSDLAASTAERDSDTAVQARVASGTWPGTASNVTPVSGSAAVLTLGQSARTGRHAALDAGVVYHEYAHSVARRLVGGAQNSSALELPQSAAIAEGFSDYIACTATRSEILGAWLVADSHGIRSQPYNSNYQGDFGDLGKGLYNETHYIGEIWCVTMIELDAAIGHELTARLVLDALKLTPANPSFLDMRDAILGALQDMGLAEQLAPERYHALHQQLWAVFAQRGMGPNAQCVGATLVGLVADFHPPATEPRVAPVPALTERVIAPDEWTRLTSVEVADAKERPRHVYSIPRVGPVQRIRLALEFEDLWRGDLLISLISDDPEPPLRVGGSPN